VNDRASTGYHTERDLDAEWLAKGRSTPEGSARAVVLDGDCLTRLKALPDASVDSCVCDPPYGLSQREPDMAEVLARWVGGESYRHEGGGFQGAQWDAFVPGPEVWREVFRVLKPGGYLLAFGAPRRYDLLALAIRIAGFTVRDSLHWVYANGNGGTKSHNLSLAIDKAAGAKRKVVGQRKTNVGLRGGNYGRGSRNDAVPVTEPATAAAKQWDGWGTSVAPAHEPIIVAQKPVEGTYAANLLEHGVGGLNIDGCKTSDGRWPKNIIYGHSAECAEECAPGCPVATLDEQHGTGLSDKFPVFRPDAAFRYCAKPSRAERNAGLGNDFEERRSDSRTGAAAGLWVDKGGAEQKNHHPTAKPVALMAWLCRLVTPPGGVVLDPFAGSGSTGCGAVIEGFRFIGVELSEEYAAIARARIADVVSRTEPIARPVPSATTQATAAPTTTSRTMSKRSRASNVGRSLRPAQVACAAAAPTPAPTFSRATAPTVAAISRSSAPALAIAKSKSGNKKLGGVATTYAAQTSCPSSCVFFDGGGCYAESGKVGITARRLNAGAKLQPSGPYEVAVAEAEAIDDISVVPERPLRLHTVGDCATDVAAFLVSDASGRYRARGGGPVWTYTHAWRDVSRESWGDVSVLASCETESDVRAAQERGYATSIVIDTEFKKKGRYRLSAEDGQAEGVEIFPCLEQTIGRTCADCTLCFDDKALKERGYTIAFHVHGESPTVRAAVKALRTPDDPDRKLTSRQLIPRVIAAMEAAGEKVTNAAIAKQLGCNSSSVAQMRKRLAREAAEQSATGRTP
jgi:site-specific DNA-methyltransferase (adenine-specific)